MSVHPKPPPPYNAQAATLSVDYGGTTNTVVFTGGPLLNAQQGSAVHAQQFRESPCQCVCPRCNASVITTTRYKTGTLTWIIAGTLLLFGLWLGCCFIPFCINGCKDVVHSCPNCKNDIKIWNRL